MHCPPATLDTRRACLVDEGGVHTVVSLPVAHSNVRYRAQDRLNALPPSLSRHEAACSPRRSPPTTEASTVLLNHAAC